MGSAGGVRFAIVQPTR